MSTESALDARPARVAATRLADLVDALRRSGVDVDVRPRPDAVEVRAVEVTGLTLDSRTVRAGDLYAALPGATTHGARFATTAIAAGAVAVLTDPEGAAAVGGPEVPVVVAPRPRGLLGGLAATVYGHPAEQMLTVGVTGTQGKTTVTYLLEAALAGAGRTTGLVGTTGARVAGRPVASRLTTPEAPELHALLAVMHEAGVDACALEVSSHALVQGRVDGVRFDVAVFLNLGRDHLDFHDGIEDYFAAKASLFTPERARRAVVDVGDPWGRRLAEECALPITTCTADAAVDADWRAVDVVLGADGSDFTAVGPDDRRVRSRVPLPGAFNVRNALAVVAAADSAGLDLDAAAAALGHAPGVPGRMERIDAGQDFLAVVDYAHKPDAVEAVLSAVRPATAGRLLVVLGAGGDRDPGKRTLMGEVAGRLADVVVVTDDNPRGEDPARIRAGLLAGAGSGDAELVEVGDRGAAIAHAVGLAGPGDTLVVAGKGHETGQEIAGTVHPFDDRNVLRAALQGRREQEAPA